MTNLPVVGQRTFLAEATRHGSAYVGLLRILRAYSFEEAMTMKLQVWMRKRMRISSVCE